MTPVEAIQAADKILSEAGLPTFSETYTSNQMLAAEQAELRAVLEPFKPLLKILTHV